MGSWVALGRPLGSGRDIAVLAASAVGIGLSVGSWSVQRDSCYFENVLFVPAVPVVMAFVALVLAIVFWKRCSESRSRALSMYGAVVVFVLVQLVAMLLAPTVSKPELFSLGLVATLAEGASSALLTFLFLANLVRFEPRQMALAVASGYLLVHLYDGAFLSASEEVRLLQRPIALVAMTMIAGVIVHRIRRRSSAEIEGPSFFAHADGGRVRSAECVGDYVLFAGFVCVPLLIQGVYSQLTGLGSVGNVQEFNFFTELFAAGVRAGVLVWCLLLTDDMPLSHAAACASLICLVGIPAVDLLWGTGAYLIGSHIINSARYILLPVVMIVGVQVARRHPNRAVPLIFLMIFAANSCYISRFITALLAAASPIDVDAVLPTVSLCAMWVVACAIPAYLLVGRWLRARRPQAEGFAGAVDPAFARELAFYQRLERLCDGARLTGREKDVLCEALHGYSIDGIARRLDLSSSTVKTYLSRIYGRFGVNSKQAILNLLDAKTDDEEEPADCAY